MLNPRSGKLQIISKNFIIVPNKMAELGKAIGASTDRETMRNDNLQHIPPEHNDQ